MTARQVVRTAHEAVEPAAEEAADETQAAVAARPSRRALTTVVLLAMLGGVLATVASGRVWVQAGAGQDPLTQTVTATGGDLSGAVSALGLAALAGGLALLATVRLGRQLIGLLLTAAGLGLACSALTANNAAHAVAVLGDKAGAQGIGRGVRDVSDSDWCYLAVFGGLVVTVAGVTAVVRGRAWPGMSSRYEAPVTRDARTAATAVRSQHAGTPKGLWDALDRGEDPTSATGSTAAVRAAVPAAVLAAVPAAVPAAAVTPGSEH